MIELAPHPVFRLPTQEQARAMSLEDFNTWLAARDTAIENERRDPFIYGFEPEIWNLVDDLLVDGNKVILDLTRIAKLSPDGKAPMQVDVPKEIEGATEIWIPGSNRSSKSEYAGKKIMKVLKYTDGARTWSFADTGPISIARQQPIFWKYMPLEIKRLAADTGKARQGVTLNVSYKQKTGFAEQSFVLPNGAQHWFKNYEQDPGNVEGDQLDAIWLDELRNIELLRTLRGRTIDRGGLVIVTFTSIDENYTAVVNEYERGARTVLEVEAELLPIKRPKQICGGMQSGHAGPGLKDHSAQGAKGAPDRAHREHQRGQCIPSTTISAGNDALEVKANPVNPEKDPEEPGSPAEKIANGNGWPDNDASRSGPASAHDLGAKGGPGNGATVNGPAAQELEFEIVGYEKVPRVKVAGPGNDGNLRANIVFFHITDNPYFGYEGAMQRRKAGRAPLFGKERFYRAYRNATRSKILSRVYGILQAGSAQQFTKFSDAVHVVEPDRIPRYGSNFHLVDPHDGRNWAMLWLRIDPANRWYFYREWPSFGHPGAYIPGIGDPGPWTLPGKPADGVPGPAQNPFGFGLDAYKAEIARLEGWPEEEEEGEGEPEEEDETKLWTGAGRRNRLPGRPLRPGWMDALADDEPQPDERIEERWMDSRYGALPTRTREGTTTLIEQCSELGLEFKAASGKEISEGVALINDKLDYDKEVPLGEFSPKLARLNAPKLFVSRNCPNLIYAIREWTGKDGNKGACKEWIDLLRYAALAGLEYVGEGAYTWQKG
jgi:hypothetical protein